MEPSQSQRVYTYIAWLGMPEYTMQQTFKFVLPKRMGQKVLLTPLFSKRGVVVPLTPPCIRTCE